MSSVYSKCHVGGVVGWRTFKNCNWLLFFFGYFFNWEAAKTYCFLVFYDIEQEWNGLETSSWQQQPKKRGGKKGGLSFPGFGSHPAGLSSCFPLPSSFPFPQQKQQALSWRDPSHFLDFLPFLLLQPQLLPATVVRFTLLHHKCRKCG